MRYELLSANLFDLIDEAQDAATKWQWIYNNERSKLQPFLLKFELDFGGLPDDDWGGDIVALENT